MSFRVFFVLLFAGLGSPFLSGCVAATAISVASETVQAGVGVTGAVIGTSVDLVMTSDEERERKKR